MMAGAGLVSLIALLVLLATATAFLALVQSRGRHVAIEPASARELLARGEFDNEEYYLGRD